MNLKIFQIAIILHPTEEESKKGLKTTFIQEPTFVLAKDQKAAEMQSLIELDKKYKDKFDRIEIACRPF